MKAVVLLPYRDKADMKMHFPGEVVDVTAKRFKEINSYGINLEQKKTEQTDEGAEDVSASSCFNDEKVGKKTDA